MSRPIKASLIFLGEFRTRAKIFEATDGRLKAATVNGLDLEGYHDHPSACSDVCGAGGADNIWSSFIFPQRAMSVLSNSPPPPSR